MSSSYSAKAELNLGGGSSSSSSSSERPANTVNPLLAACTREYGGPSHPYWSACMDGTILPGSVQLPSATAVKVVQAKWGTTSSPTTVSQAKWPAKTGTYKFKVPSLVLKPRTQAEAVQGGREFEVSTGTIVIGLLLVGVAGYMVFKKKGGS